MKMSKSRYIQLIHIGKTQLQWDNDLYRQILLDLVGVSSCKDMSVNQLDTVLSHMKSKGFKPITKQRGKGKNSPISRDKEDKTQLDKLRQLWIAMHACGFLRDGSDDALLAWSKNQIKRRNKGIAIERLEWLKTDMLHALIEQLKQWRERLEVQHA
ncbi:gp16 family protein [Pseudoalteromonas xiamenensis]